LVLIYIAVVSSALRTPPNHFGKKNFETKNWLSFFVASIVFLQVAVSKQTFL
jgi:hypothetical protein